METRLAAPVGTAGTRHPCQPAGRCWESRAEDRWRDAGRDEDALLLALLWLWEMWESSGRGPSVLCLQPIIRGLSDEKVNKVLAN